MKKRILFLTGIIAIIIFSISNACAFLVSPPAKVIDFKPNLDYSFEYQIGNRDSVPVSVVMAPAGDLNESIILSDKKATIMPDEWKTFTAKVKLPASIDVPGIHRNKIQFEEENSQATSSVSGKVVIEMLVWIRVPYPGKYIEAKFEMPDGKANEKMTIKILIANRGKENIKQAKAAIDVYDMNGARAGYIVTDAVSLEVGEEKYIQADWTPTLKAGKYLAKAHITYDQNFAELEKEFRIGELLIDINNVLMNERGISKNSISKFLVEVESKWNEEIKNAYIILETSANGKTTSAKSETFDIAAWKIKQIPVFWDSSGYETGKYDGKVTVYYENRETEKNFQFEIKETNIFKIITSKDALLVVLIVILSVFILLNAIQFFRKYKLVRAKNTKNA